MNIPCNSYVVKKYRKNNSSKTDNASVNEISCQCDIQTKQFQTDCNNQHNCIDSDRFHHSQLLLCDNDIYTNCIPENETILSTIDQNSLLDDDSTSRYFTCKKEENEEHANLDKNENKSETLPSSKTDFLKEKENMDKLVNDNNNLSSTGNDKLKEQLNHLYRSPNVIESIEKHVEYSNRTITHGISLTDIKNENNLGPKLQKCSSKYCDTKTSPFNVSNGSSSVNQFLKKLCCNHKACQLAARICDVYEPLVNLEPIEMTDEKYSNSFHNRATNYAPVESTMTQTASVGEELIEKMYRKQEKATDSNHYQTSIEKDRVLKDFLTVKENGKVENQIISDFDMGTIRTNDIEQSQTTLLEEEIPEKPFSSTRQYDEAAKQLRENHEKMFGHMLDQSHENKEDVSTSKETIGFPPDAGQSGKRISLVSWKVPKQQHADVMPTESDENIVLHATEEMKRFRQTSNIQHHGMFEEILKERLTELTESIDRLDETVNRSSELHSIQKTESDIDTKCCASIRNMFRRKKKKHATINPPSSKRRSSIFDSGGTSISISLNTEKTVSTVTPIDEKETALNRMLNNM